MPLAMSEKNKSINDIIKYFDWFNKQFSATLSEVVSEFWNISANISLFALEKNSKNFSQGNEYFVTQAEIKGVKYSVKLSENFCGCILTSALGQNEDNSFDFSAMTELEANIIFKFNNKILKALDKFFVDKKTITKRIEDDEKFEDIVNLGFLVKTDNVDFELGKIILSIPLKFFVFPNISAKEGILDVTKFKKTQTFVDIYVGKTRLSLDEINNLDTDDIVLLEKSDIKKMEITSPASIPFNVNPDPRLFINNETDEIDLQEEDIQLSTKDIWDNVQVDVCAKFPKVKMCLGELREMTEGIVMELDSIYGNKVTLEVENRNVAEGELVIIGDKYGVKITGIFAQPEESDTDNADNADSNADDFDVKDFEIEE